MEKINILLVFLLVYTTSLSAQNLKGTVYELNGNQGVSQVEVTNLRTAQSVYTDEKGDFTISTNKDDLLSFSYPGYRIDTVMITDFDFKRVYLTPLENMNILTEVEIQGMSDQRLAEEIKKAKGESRAVSTIHSGGIAISPSRLFGKSAKDARKRYELLILEQQNRLILKKFNPILITSLTPLKGRDLDLFMVKYKPSYSFVNSADDEQLNLYIMDSYKKYKALTEQEKNKITLKK